MARISEHDDVPSGSVRTQNFIWMPPA